MSGLISLTPEQFTQFQQFIYRHTGIWTVDGKIALLSNRIRRRLRDRGLDSFDDYYKLLTTGNAAGELEAFIDAITTNETHFFRTIEHFNWFAGPFLDEMTARATAGQRERSLRIWSAACSTGEEPYSLAICLAENAPRLAGWSLKIVGPRAPRTPAAEKEGSPEAAIPAAPQRPRSAPATALLVCPHGHRSSR